MLKNHRSDQVYKVKEKRGNKAHEAKIADPSPVETALESGDNGIEDQQVDKEHSHRRCR